MIEQHHASAFESIADAIPDAPALAQGDRITTWGEMESRASRLSGAMLDAGLGIQKQQA